MIIFIGYKLSALERIIGQIRLTVSFQSDVKIRPIGDYNEASDPQGTGMGLIKKNSPVSTSISLRA